MIAVIITTLNEEKNIGTLIPAIHAELKDDYVIIVVDDNSQDKTQEIVIGLSKQYPVKLLPRPKKMGIASAILDGMRFQEADAYITMEGDNSHPPSVLPLIRKALNNHDLVVASRYVDCGTGRSKNWPLSRKIVSFGANLLARPLTSITDKTTGMIGIQSHCLEGVELETIGMHFPLECFVKANYDTYIEIPYTYLGRINGASKFSFKEVLNYLKHLMRLYIYRIKEWSL
jgi:dolichol-phosphate mannosyltransferase